MLTQLRVKNFRLLRDVTIDFDSVVTVLVGPNASGKSTVLEVLDFVSRCAEDGLEKAVAAHGGFDSIRTAGVTEPIVIGMRWNFGAGDLRSPLRGVSLEWEVALQVERGGVVEVCSERLANDTDPKNPRIVVDTDDLLGRIVSPEVGKSAEVRLNSMSNRLAFEVLADPSRFPTLGHLRVLLKSTRVIGALPTSPSWARSDVMTASPRDSVVLGPQQFIGRQGLGLANVLYTLFTDHADAWRDLDRDFRGEFRFVERMTFPAEMSGSKIAFAFEDSRFKGRKMFASEMSDGMVAYLCLLATVHNPEQVGALGLDEPDANLHPSALRRFLSAAQRPHPRGRRLIIVTHSNALLDELDDPASSIRLVDSTKDGTVIRKLDAAALDAWRKDFSLSDLRRTGLIDASNTAYWSEVAGEE